MLKNLLLVFVALVCLYMYLHPQTETRVITQAAAPVVVRAPAPPPAPAPVSKLYYHSPLDASAMSTSASTGPGYFSNDAASSRFNTGYYGPSTYYGSAPAVGTVSGAPVYVPGGSNTQINTIIVSSGIRPTATPAKRAYAGPLPNR